MARQPAEPRRTSALEVLSSTAVNTVVGVVGLALPIFAFVLRYDTATTVILVVEAGVIAGLVARDEWRRSRHLVARRGDPADMADAGFFEAIERDVVQRRLTEIEDLADGYLRVFAAEVPYISVLLLKTLTDSTSGPRLVLATDLTRDPQVLFSRREYLAVNRNLIKAGGSVQRIFICTAADLASFDFGRDLVALVEQHRRAGVQCGLAVRDQIRPTEAVDFVVIGRAAVLVEEEQGTVGYSSGRSTVQFKRVDIWRNRFTRLWDANETPAATEQLAAYETAVRAMPQADSWSEDQVRKALDLQ